LKNELLDTWPNAAVPAASNMPKILMADLIKSASWLVFAQAAAMPSGVPVRIRATGGYPPLAEPLCKARFYTRDTKYGSVRLQAQESRPPGWPASRAAVAARKSIITRENGAHE